MRASLKVPILDDLAPDGFSYGGHYIVEFDPPSPWYETSLTIAALALKQGMKTEYHVFQHFPAEAIEALSGLGIDAGKSQKEGLLKIVDAYTETTKFVARAKGKRDWKSIPGNPLDLRGDVPFFKKWMKAHLSEKQKRWIHIDDNSGIFLQYNDERVFLDIWRTVHLPATRAAEFVHFLAFPKGVGSDTFFTKFEALCDGIIDVKSEQDADQIAHFIRIRMLRGKACDTRWHRLQLLDHGEVALVGVSPRRGSRRLAAIMYTDLAGYAALAQSNESLSLRVLNTHRQLLRPIFSKHDGRVVKTLGDGFLVEFASALDAVKCAYDIQGAVREFNLSGAREDRIHLRVGIHLGDVIESGDDILGDAVNVASRIERFATDGGISLTQPVYDQVWNKFELSIKSLGRKRLKHVSNPVEVYRVVLPWERSYRRAGPGTKSSRPV